jgi:hypothetical protein
MWRRVKGIRGKANGVGEADRVLSIEYGVWGRLKPCGGR